MAHPPITTSFWSNSVTTSQVPIYGHSQSIGCDVVTPILGYAWVLEALTRGPT